MPRIVYEYRGVKVGDEFDRLTIIGPFFTTTKNRAGSRWFCVVQCKCGTIKTAEARHLQYGNIVSCGCSASERAIKAATANRKHGLDSHPLANIWRGMKWRCDKVPENDPKFQYYRGRGITYCQEWTSLPVFVEWCLSNGWKPGLELDRFPDQDGNYEPGNIRFATRTENMRNTSYNRLITAWGETKTLAEWVIDSRCMASHTSIRWRLSDSPRQRKWTPEEAIGTPPTK